MWCVVEQNNLIWLIDANKHAKIHGLKIIINAYHVI